MIRPPDVEYLSIEARRVVRYLPAILFEAPYIPDDWVEVARWKISQNLVCWSDTVSLYVIDPDVGDIAIAELNSEAANKK